MHAIAHLKVLGTTVVVIAHRPSILGLADKLLVLRTAPSTCSASAARSSPS